MVAIPHRNRNLFSEYYLSTLLPADPEWEVEVSTLWERIGLLYRNCKEELPRLKESSLEERFIRPVLKELGHTFETQPTLSPTLEGTKRPDYALFPDEATRRAALLQQGEEGFFKQVHALCEVKRWGRPLDNLIETHRPLLTKCTEDVNTSLTVPKPSNPLYLGRGFQIFIHPTFLDDLY